MKTIITLLIALTLPALAQDANRDNFNTLFRAGDGVVVQQFTQSKVSAMAGSYMPASGNSLASIGGGGYKRAPEIYTKKGKKYFMPFDRVNSFWGVNFKFESTYTITDKTVKFKGETIPIIKMERYWKHVPKK